MLRRTFLACAACAPLARPALAAPAGRRTLLFVPQANLTSLDPVWTTALVTRNYALLVFDLLYGLDTELRPSPQMAEGHIVDDAGLRWTVRLRDGLRFHDGERVLARDCTASLARWMRRDSLGQTLAARLDALEAPDDRTIVFRLRKPFPSLPFALAKTQANQPVIMPERIATTDPFKQVIEVVGSGPFRWVPDDYVPGSRAVFARFDGYQPRAEPPSFTAGAKRVLVDRVEWRVIPEAATAVNALRAGEVDWVEQPLPDMVPLLTADRNVVVDTLDTFGLYPVLRFNSLQGPTAKQAVRQAIMAAIDTREVMQAAVGNNPDLFKAPVGVFLPGTALANDAGMAAMGPKDPAIVRKMLADAGYDGSRVVLMHATDQPIYDAMSQVVLASMKKVGLNMDDQAMDWGTIVQRRASKEPIDAGGWSIFCASFPAADYLNPLAAPAIRGNGGTAWFGWPNDPAVEQLRDAWIDSDDDAERKRLAAEIQRDVLTQALYVPLGNYYLPSAWRKTVTGLLKGPVPVFWNVSKT